MPQRAVDFIHEPNGDLRTALTQYGASMLREDCGLRFDGDGRLSAQARARYEAYGADRALVELLAYQLANGWELTDSNVVGGLVSSEAPILSDSLVRDARGTVVWNRSLFWYAHYQVYDPVIQLARHGVVTFKKEADLIFCGAYVDLTRQGDGTLLLEPTTQGRAWLAEDEFEYPEFDELLEDHLRGMWSYEVAGDLHVLANPHDGAFAFRGAPQMALDRDGRLLMAAAATMSRQQPRP
jgi:hypothetical protein